MDIVYPERKKVVNELPIGNSTNSTSNSTNAQTNQTKGFEDNKGDKTNEQQKVKSDL